MTLPLADEMDTTTPNIQMVYTKVNLREQKSDFAYWQTQPYQARLAALEQIRREFHQWRYGAEPRLESLFNL